MQTEPNRYHLDRISLMGASALGAYVYPCGRGWKVELDGFTTPIVFKTKTEALKHAEARVYMAAGDLVTEPWMYKAAVRPARWTTPANWD